jgi:hypothetical protein
LAKADTAFKGESVGQPTEPCLAKPIPNAERPMLRVLDLDPTIQPGGATAALAVLRDQAFESHQAGVPDERNRSAHDPVAVLA